MQSGSVQSGKVWLTSSATVAPAADSGPAPLPAVQPVELKTVGWALRRAALGLLILLTVAGLSAWLLDASIERDGAAGVNLRSEYALPPG